MPGNYAHYKFGKKVYRELNKDIMGIIREHENLFYIGLFGPDILFYNSVIKGNRITRTGHSLHEALASGFFSNAKNVIRYSDNKNAAIAYITGYICHFILDSECHGYIEYKKRESSVSHSLIETEFEKDLMINKGKDIFTYSALDHVEIDDSDIKIIASFYRSMDEKEIKKSLINMKKVSRILIGRTKLKRNFVKMVLLFSGNYSELKDLLIKAEIDERCRDSNLELRKRFKHSIGIAANLAEDYYRHLESDRLSYRFARTYGVDTLELRKCEEMFCIF